MMGKYLKTAGLILVTMLCFQSCRKEESELSGQDPRALEANSALANLLSDTSLADGSFDNILDQANCLSIKLPVTVRANGQEIQIQTTSDYALVEAVFDEFTNDTDILEIEFPISVVRVDFSEVAVGSQAELNALAVTCSGENQPDDDLECADIVYPVSISLFNPQTEILETVTLNGDQDLFEFIKDLDSEIIASINFPVSVLLADGMLVSAGDMDQLEIILDSARDTCDEDDDFDYNDDDCPECTLDYLEQVLTGCTEWYVDKLERNSASLEELYSGYDLSFQADGTVAIIFGVNVYPGTWVSGNTGGIITLDLDIPLLPDFSNTWILNEIQESGEHRVEFRQPDDDRLRLQSTCL